MLNSKTEKTAKIEKSEKMVSIDLLICLFALVFMSVYYYGFRALIVTTISAATCYATDIFCIYLRKEKFEFGDTSAIITGIIFALLMPASNSYGMLIISSIIMII